MEERNPTTSLLADRALTSQEMLNEIQAFTSQYGWRELFELINSDFQFHAHDRGESEDWKARPKNTEQLELIRKLCAYSHGEFEIGR